MRELVNLAREDEAEAARHERGLEQVEQHRIVHAALPRAERVLNPSAARVC